MSHVYEAMRRAAEAQLRTPDSAAPGRTAHSDLATGVDFPAESAAPAVAVLSPDPPPPAPEQPRPRSATIADATPSSFTRVPAAYEGKTLLYKDVPPQSREQYRRLAASLHEAQALRGIKVVMITSAAVGEGKTLTTANVALTLSHSYRKQVLVIDADLRRPSLPAVFGIQCDVGLSEGLTGGHGVPVHQVSPRLAVLAAGRPTSDPIAALTSERMRRLIEEARHMFDWIVLDTPPVALLSDANLLSSLTDGAVLVIKAAHTPLDMVSRAVQAIGRERVLGTVLNRAAVPTHATYSYYDYYGPSSNRL